MRESKDRAVGSLPLPLFILLACFPKCLLIARVGSGVAEVGGLGPEEAGMLERVGKARPLRSAAAHCGLDRLVAREDSRTLSSTDLQLAREQSDAGHRRMPESPNCL